MWASRAPWCPTAAVTNETTDTRDEKEPNLMRRTSGMPVGGDVRERLRAAQRSESEAIAAVQRAMTAEADSRARLEGVILRHQVEVSKAARGVQAAQASLVRTSGLERAAAVLDVTSKVLRSAVKETAQDASVHTASDVMRGQQST